MRKKIENNKVWRHAAFWAVYFCITFFNELFLTSDFTLHSSFSGLMKMLFSEINMLAIKMALVYYVLYSFIPRWLKGERKGMLIVEGCGVMIATVVVYRAVIQYVNWQLIFHDMPRNMSRMSLAARYTYSLLEILQVAGIAAAIKLSRLRLSAVQNEKALIRDTLKSELQHLKAQINPHFLFNMLNSIYSLSTTMSPKTPEVVSKLSELLRYMLYQSEQVLMPISEELKIIAGYTELQYLRYGSRIKIIYETDIDDQEEMITPLIILPLVENAFKHGIGLRDDNSYVHIYIALHSGLLAIDIENSLIHEAKDIAAHEGIGLANIKRRLSLLYREAQLNVKKEEQSFKVNLSIKTNSYVGVEMFDTGR